MVKRTDLPPEMAALADEILSHGIDAEEVLRLRRDVFKDGIVSRDEVKLLFHLNEQSAIGHDDAWYAFFIEVLTDHFVRQQEPEGYLNPADAEFLAELVMHDGRIDDATEFALVLNILQRLRVAPERLVELALEGVRQTVLGGGTVLFGPKRRRRGVIDDADVEIIRAVVFAAGGDGSLTITRREADLLLDLNRQTSEKKNAAAWQKLFVEAVGHHLMYPGRAPEAPDRAEALRRQRWLDERRGALGFIAEMGRGLRGLVKAGKATGDGPPPRDGDAVPPAEAFARASVDAAEARWLAGRLSEDRRLDPNEVALLAYIKQMAPQVDPALDPLFAKAGL